MEHYILVTARKHQGDTGKEGGGCKVRQPLLYPNHVEVHGHLHVRS